MIRFFQKDSDPAKSDFGILHWPRSSSLANRDTILLKAPVDTDEELQTILDAGFTEMTSLEEVLTQIIFLRPAISDADARAWRDA